MPVRKIPKNHLTVTGGFASRKNGRMESFESPLEKEYMLLLEFDDEVESFEEQPVTIPLPGVPRGYTPDILIRFRPDADTGEIRPPELTEIKHSDDLRRNAEKYAPKFATAERFAADKGWEFRIVTEQEIRTPRLANLKFLREYRNIDPEEDACAHIIATIQTAEDGMSLAVLLDRISSTDEERLYWLPIIWHLVLWQVLRVDLDAKLNNDSVLSLSENPCP